MDFVHGTSRSTQLRSVHSRFKSPLLKKEDEIDSMSCSAHTSDQMSSQHLQREMPGTLLQSGDVIESIQREVVHLKEQLTDVEQHIQQLKQEGLDASELEEHVTKLHEYNEIKDIAQMVLGHIATLKGVRTRDIYPQYGLDLDD